MGKYLNYNKFLAHMEPKKVLEEVGLSKSESMVYISLLKLGKTKSGKVIQKTGLQSSTVHNALNMLAEKGFISHILEGKVKQYIALDPKIIRKYLDLKKEQFEQVLPNLELFFAESMKEFPMAEVYAGYKGILNAILKLIGDKKKGETYKYFAAKETLLSEDAIAFFKKADDLKKKAGLKVRGIAEDSAKELLKEYKGSQIRYTKQKIPPAMNIYRDGILIFSFSGRPTAILIKSKEISIQYHSLWDELWKRSK